MIKQKIKLDEDKPKDFMDMICPSAIKFNIDHFICGNTFRSVYAIREYPSSTTEQAILRHLGEKDGVTLHIYTRQVTINEEKRIIDNATNKNKLGMSNNNLKENITAQNNLDDVATIISDMYRNKE
ncbi:MAG: type VI secretion protein, partial [Clostridia bacterium]